MVFIILKNDNILSVYESIDIVYSNILTYIKIILYCDKNKLDFFNDLKIIEYSNNCPINSYKIDINSFDLYDEHDNKIVIKNSILSRNKVELEVLLKKDIESDVNIFIPVNDQLPETSDEINHDIYIKHKINNNEQYQNKQNTLGQVERELMKSSANERIQGELVGLSNTNKGQENNEFIEINKLNEKQGRVVNVNEQQELMRANVNERTQRQVVNVSEQQEKPINRQNELKKQIDLLKMKIELEKIKLQKNNIKYTNNVDKYLEDKHQVGLFETDQKNINEKEEEQKRIFKADKSMFECLVNEMNEKSREKNDVPDLFRNKFKIFEKLKLITESIKLTESEEYDKYLNIKQTITLDDTKTDNKYDCVFNNTNSLYEKIYEDLKSKSKNNNEDDETDKDNDEDENEDENENEDEDEDENENENNK